MALVVGGGPGVSASCARLFTQDGMQVAVAARNPDKPVLKKLAQEQGVHLYQCDASEPDAVLKLFQAVSADLGSPRLVVHNIDGRTQDIFRKEITEADPSLVLDTIKNSAYSAFLVGQQAAKSMLADAPGANGQRGTSSPTRVQRLRATRRVGRLRSPLTARPVWRKAWRENSCLKASTLHTCRLTPLLVGRRTMGAVRTAWLGRRWRTIWRTRQT